MDLGALEGGGDSGSRSEAGAAADASREGGAVDGGRSPDAVSPSNCTTGVMPEKGEILLVAKDTPGVGALTIADDELVWTNGGAVHYAAGLDRPTIPAQQGACVGKLPPVSTPGDLVALYSWGGILYAYTPAMSDGTTNACCTFMFALGESSAKCGHTTGHTCAGWANDTLYTYFAITGGGAGGGMEGLYADPFDGGSPIGLGEKIGTAGPEPAVPMAAYSQVLYYADSSGDIFSQPYASPSSPAMLAAGTSTVVAMGIGDTGDLCWYVADGTLYELTVGSGVMTLPRKLATLSAPQTGASMWVGPTHAYVTDGVGIVWVVDLAASGMLPAQLASGQNKPQGIVAAGDGEMASQVFWANEADGTIRVTLYTPP